MALSSFARGLIQFLFLAPSPRFLIFKFFWGSSSVAEEYFFGAHVDWGQLERFSDTQEHKKTHTQNTQTERLNANGLWQSTSLLTFGWGHIVRWHWPRVCVSIVLFVKKKTMKKVQFFPPATLGFSCLANLNSNRQKKTVFFWPFLPLDFQHYFPLCWFIYEKKPFKNHSLFTRTKQLLSIKVC